MDDSSINFRTKINPEDKEIIHEIVVSTHMFSPEEVRIAVELLEDGLIKGDNGDYHFLFADIKGKIIGYSCYGPIAATSGSFNLYWIVISKELQGLGYGKRLLGKTERIIKKMGGRCIYIETSSREQYKNTRAFYLSCGYQKEAVLKDFYSPQDSKIIYTKRL